LFPELILESEGNLIRRRRSGRAEIQANVDWQKVLLSQPGKQACLKKGCLSKARNTIQDRRAILLNQRKQRLRFNAAAEEKIFVRFSKRSRPRPWPLDVYLRGLRHTGRLNIVDHALVVSGS
jgi:hypothetical protein